MFQVSGCFDLLHSGHVEFFRQAAQHGDLYVRLGTDANIKALKNHDTMYKVGVTSDVFLYLKALAVGCDAIEHLPVIAIALVYNS